MTTTHITALIRDHFCVDAVEPTHTLADLGADSLDIVELAMLIEEAFHVTIEDDEMELFGPDLPNGKTVADLVAMVEGKVAGKVLGHTRIETTARYAHVEADDIRNALEIVEQSRNSPEQEETKVQENGRNSRGAA